MADFKDYYKILGVEKTATEKDIKQAYRTLARKYHGDTPGGKSEEAQARMREINEANDILSDSEKRRKYDVTMSQPDREGVFPGSWFVQENPFVPQSGTSPSSVQNPKEEQKDELTLPANDIPLLRVLIDAYNSKEDGDWETGRMQEDRRERYPEKPDGVSEIIYRVERKNGKVSISRRVDDWRSTFDRDAVIHSINSRNFEQKKYDPRDFIPEVDLIENQILSSGLLVIPRNLGAYYWHLKLLAKRISREGFLADYVGVEKEVGIINQYTNDYQAKHFSLFEGIRSFRSEELQHGLSESEREISKHPASSPEGLLIRMSGGEAKG